MKATLILVTGLVIFFSSCTKDNYTATDYITEISEHADDQSRFSTEIDAAVNDAGSIIESSSSFSGKNDNLQSVISDATFTIDTAGASRSVTINYNGTNCLGNRSRTGTITLSMAAGIRWRNAGAIINITYQNLKITRLSDNKSITINGTQAITNVTGGLIMDLASMDSIVHTITSSNMSLTLDNGNQRTWQVARKRVFTYNNGIVISTTGMHSNGATTGITEWGINRFGNQFTTAILQPLVIRQDCDFRMVSGKLNHWTHLFNAKVSFGLDSSGNPAICPGMENYYLKIEWTGPSGIRRTVILPY